MIRLDTIKNFYPDYLAGNAGIHKYLLKEYILLLILDYLSATSFIRKVVFIGGTSLRIVKNIDRFSEDLDFDCKSFLEGDFIKMTDSIINFLRNNGLHVEAKEKDDKNLKAFRRNIHFPELLYKMGLTGHKEERFRIKIECQDQLVDYNPEIVNIKGCGFFFPMPVPPAAVLCSMKISAMLSRQKGRDFYDVMFLLSQTLPDFKFLSKRCGISNMDELKKAAEKMLETVNLKSKTRDFEHLLFNKNNSRRILIIAEFFKNL